jgi:hypothetical protein
MIRNKFLASITKQLNEFPFSQNDFDINMSESYNGNSIHIKITYRYIEKFNFSFTLPKNSNPEINADRCPGAIVENESIILKGKDSLLSSISNWLFAINEEMTYMPFVREFEEAKAKFSVMEEKFNEIPNQYFSKEEGELLKQKLENLEKDFEQKLREEIVSKETLENEIFIMKQDLEQLKSQVDSLNKRGWFKSFGTKIYGWGTKYPKTTAFLAAAGIQLLPEELQEFIPKEELINAILPEGTTETPKLIESTEPAKELIEK